MPRGDLDRPRDVAADWMGEGVDLARQMAELAVVLRYLALNRELILEMGSSRIGTACALEYAADQIDGILAREVPHVPQ
jgi:hypothetical protein